MINKYRSLIYMVSISLFAFNLTACGGSDGAAAKPFKIKVRTTNPGVSSDVQFQIPTKGSGYSYNVDCDSDGTLEATGQTSDYICNYDATGSGDYVISISGEFPQIFFNQTGFNISDAEKVIEIKQWGTGIWRSMAFAFAGCSNMISTATDKPVLNQVTNLRWMFSGTKFNQNINDWDVSNVVNMGYMFNNSEFNQALDRWDVSKVTDMSGMFANSQFNQDISGWNVSSVTVMGIMFYGSQFNLDIRGWDVSSVTSMYRMFMFSSFNQDINNWDVSNLMNLDEMFRGASFDNKLGNWKINAAQSVDGIFFASTLSPENYDDLLIGWSSNNNLPHNLSFHGGNSVTGTLEGSQARASLRNNFGWTITDGDSP